MDKIQIRATPAQADVIVTALQIARNVSRDTAWADEAQAIEVWIVHLATRHERRQAAAAQLAAPPEGQLVKFREVYGATCSSCGADWAAASAECPMSRLHGAAAGGRSAQSLGSSDPIERARLARVRAQRARQGQG
jgi:hypothetical protein